MDVIIEFILELLLELGFESAKSNRLARWIRIALLVLITLFYGAVIAIIMLVGVISKNGFTLALMSILSLGVLAMLVKHWYKVMKNHPFQS